MTSLKVDRLFQYCSAGHSLCIQHTAQDPSVGWSHPHGVQHPLASWSAEIRGMVLHITFIHTEEVRIQYLEDGLAYPLTKAYICAPHHTGPQTGVHHSGFHVHHGGLLLRGAELPEAVRGRGCQGHVRPQAPRERCCGQRDRTLRRHHHAVSNQFICYLP